MHKLDKSESSPDYCDDFLLQNTILHKHRMCEYKTNMSQLHTQLIKLG
jgi:hypothetical protein